MFTGIIQAVGSISAMDVHGGDMRVSIAAGALPMDDVELGDSIAVSGVCLTVIDFWPTCPLKRCAVPGWARCRRVTPSTWKRR